MRTFEMLYSEFHGSEIDIAQQIAFYSASGEELKKFVDYCMEMAYRDGYEFADKQTFNEIQKFHTLKLK